MSSRPHPIEALPASAANLRARAWFDPLLERGLLPDWLVRAGIRRICAARLKEQEAGGRAGQTMRKAAFVAEIERSPIALQTAMANSQHYEVPSGFFRYALGRRMKYSSGYWPDGVTSLDAAEEAMLDLYCQRAQLRDGQQVLELGCGWGSLSLYLAERYPASSITAVSNSRTQKEWIGGLARERGLRNLTIVTADMNIFEAPRNSFDRVLSVEMFEHMRNWPALLARIAAWMKPEALFFLHIFAHSRFAYPYEVRDASDWMAQHFFTGGMMPSDDLLSHFQRDLAIVNHWRLSGTHYQKTANAWLANMDRHRAEIMPLLGRAYGDGQQQLWWVRWRIFFMACAELWGFAGGREWLVSHYLLKPR